MGKNENAQRISKKEIKTRLITYTKILEGLGMSRDEACNFISGIMNLGLAVRESVNLKHGSSFFYIFDEKGLNGK